MLVGYYVRTGLNLGRLIDALAEDDEALRERMISTVEEILGREILSTLDGAT